MAISKNRQLEALRTRSLTTATDLSKEASKNICASLNALLADIFALYLKKKISTGMLVVRISGVIIFC